MALVFCDGFDHYSINDATKKWTTTSGSDWCNIGSAYSRNSTGQGLGLGSSYSYFSKTFGVDYETIIIGFALKVSIGTIVNSTSVLFLTLYDGTTKQLKVRVNSANIIEVLHGGTDSILCSTTTPLNQGLWYYFEIKATISNTAGYIAIRLNGETVGSASGLDTQNSSNSYINRMYLSCTEGGVNDINNSFDDLYVCDTSGATNKDFLGDITVETLYPNANGNYSQWTPLSGNNYENVNEILVDGDTTYNSTNTAGYKDSYAFSNLSTTGMDVRAIAVNTMIAEEIAGDRTVRAFTRINSTDYEIGDSDSYLSTDYFNIQDILDQNPDDSANWEEEDINALECGIELTS